MGCAGTPLPLCFSCYGSFAHRCQGRLCSCLAPAHTAQVAPHRLARCVLLPQPGTQSPHSQVAFPLSSPVGPQTIQPSHIPALPAVHQPWGCSLLSFPRAFLSRIPYFWNALPSSLTFKKTVMILPSGCDFSALYSKRDPFFAEKPTQV